MASALGGTEVVCGIWAYLGQLTIRILAVREARFEERVKTGWLYIAWGRVGICKGGGGRSHRMRLAVMPG